MAFFLSESTTNDCKRQTMVNQTYYLNKLNELITLREKKNAFIFDQRENSASQMTIRILENLIQPWNLDFSYMSGAHTN